jgi:mRNA-degrading endonuclease RelE of RelBE toxin-antitoxin system
MTPPLSKCTVSSLPQRQLRILPRSVSSYQVRILSELEAQLPHEPTSETRNRKRLRPNKLAEWALRVNRFRIFYDVLPANSTVKVIAIGEKKGSDLFIRDEWYEL